MIEIYSLKEELNSPDDVEGLGVGADDGRSQNSAENRDFSLSTGVASCQGTVCSLLVKQHLIVNLRLKVG